jgi:hypothetical protein
MNHGADFQTLWSQLRKEVIALQTKGYYGDGNDSVTLLRRTSRLSKHLGMWSSGTRLADSARFVPGGLVDDDLPEYMVMVFFIHDLDTLYHLVASVEVRKGALGLRDVGDVDSQSLGHPC